MSDDTPLTHDIAAQEQVVKASDEKSDSLITVSDETGRSGDEERFSRALRRAFEPKTLTTESADWRGRVTREIARRVFERRLSNIDPWIPGHRAAPASSTGVPARQSTSRSATRHGTASLQELMLTARSISREGDARRATAFVGESMPELLRFEQEGASRESIVDFVASALRPLQGSDERARIALAAFGYARGEQRASPGAVLTLGIEADAMAACADTRIRRHAVAAYHLQAADVRALAAVELSHQDADVLRRTLLNACHNSAVIISDIREVRRTLSGTARDVVRILVRAAMTLRAGEPQSVTDDAAATLRGPLRSLGDAAAASDWVSVIDGLHEMGRLPSAWRSDDPRTNVALNVAAALAASVVEGEHDVTARYFNGAIESIDLDEADARIECTLYALGIADACDRQPGANSREIFDNWPSVRQCAANLSVELRRSHAWMNTTGRPAMQSLTRAVGQLRGQPFREAVQLLANAEAAGVVLPSDDRGEPAEDLRRAMWDLVLSALDHAVETLEDAAGIVLVNLLAGGSTPAWMQELADLLRSRGTDAPTPVDLVVSALGITSSIGFGHADPSTIAEAIEADPSHVAAAWQELADGLRERQLESLLDEIDAQLFR